MDPLSYLVSTRFAAQLATALFLKATVLVLGAWALTRNVRGSSPATRHSIWVATFVALLAMPFLATTVPPLPLPLLTYPAETALVGPEALEVGAVRGGLLADGGASDSGVGDMDLSTWPLPPASIALLIWWTGTLLLLVRLVSHWVRIRAMTRRAVSGGPGDRARALVWREHTRLGLRRRVRVLYTGGVAVPATWGALRPVILLPYDAREWSWERLRAVVVHEMSHIRRWDFIGQLLGEVMRIFYWANPLVAMALRDAYVEREGACDGSVLGSGVGSREYARTLVEMAERYKGGRRVTSVPALRMARPSSLRARVTDVVRGLGDARPSHWPTVLAATVAVVALLVPVGALDVWRSPPGSGPEEHLLEALDHGDATVRVRAVRALATRGSSRAAGPVSALMRDPDPRVRWSAASALGELQDPSAVADLESALDDEANPWLVRKMALESLGAIDDEAAAEAVIPYLESEDPGVRWLAIRALGRMPLQKRRTEGLIGEALRSDPDPRNRAMAAGALGMLGCTDVAGWLLSALDDPDPAVRWAARESLQQLGWVEASRPG